jgi:hypothetical protein
MKNAVLVHGMPSKEDYFDPGFYSDGCLSIRT